MNRKQYIHHTQKRVLKKFWTTLILTITDDRSKPVRDSNRSGSDRWKKLVRGTCDLERSTEIPNSNEGTGTSNPRSYFVNTVNSFVYASPMMFIRNRDVPYFEHCMTITHIIVFWEDPNLKLNTDLGLNVFIPA